MLPPTAPAKDIPSPENPPQTHADAAAKAPDATPKSRTQRRAEAFPDVEEESAARIAKADMGDFALDASHMPNFDMMTSPDSINATIAQLAEDNKAGITEARRGEITNTQLQGLVDDMPGGDAAVVRHSARSASQGLPCRQRLLWLLGSSSKLRQGA